jgi:hypothetical protein
VTADRSTYDPWAPRSAPPPTAAESSQTPTTDEVTAPNPSSPLPDDLAEISRADLIALADRYGVASYGTKAEIAERLRRKFQTA